jgi:hypothetical protein
MPGLGVINGNGARPDLQLEPRFTVPYKQRDPITLDDLRDRNFATVSETASILRCDPRTINTAIRLGEIPCTKAGVHSRIPMIWLRQQVMAGTR